MHGFFADTDNHKRLVVPVLIPGYFPEKKGLENFLYCISIYKRRYKFKNSFFWRHSVVPAILATYATLSDQDKNLFAEKKTNKPLAAPRFLIDKFIFA